MSDLIHIRVGRQLRAEIEKLIERGLFSNQSEVAREAVRELILKYKDLEEPKEARKR